MPDDRKEERIGEIDRKIEEIDALLNKFRDAISSNNGATDPRIVNEGEMLYWADHQLERNTLLAERYRLTKKSA